MQLVIPNNQPSYQYSILDRLQQIQYYRFLLLPTDMNSPQCRTLITATSQLGITIKKLFLFAKSNYIYSVKPDVQCSRHQRSNKVYSRAYPSVKTIWLILYVLWMHYFHMLKNLIAHVRVQKSSFVCVTRQGNRNDASPDCCRIKKM